MQAPVASILQHQRPMARDTMQYWLALAARGLRERRGRLQVHIAATLNVNQATINRFESGITSGRWGPDPIVAAYAEDLDLDARDIWALALRAWREYGEPPSRASELITRDEGAGAAISDLLAGPIEHLLAELDPQPSADVAAQQRQASRQATG